MNRYDLINLWQGTQAKLITWESFQRAQDDQYPRCASGDGKPGKYIIRGLLLCEACADAALRPRERP
jgi:hypothetical protein